MRVLVLSRAAYLLSDKVNASSASLSLFWSFRLNEEEKGLNQTYWCGIGFAYAKRRFIILVNRNRQKGVGGMGRRIMGSTGRRWDGEEDIFFQMHTWYPPALQYGVWLRCPVEHAVGPHHSWWLSAASVARSCPPVPPLWIHGRGSIQTP